MCRGKRWCRYAPRTLIALHMVPKTSARSERYVVGRLEVVAGRTWMSGGGNTLSPAEMRKRYDLWWGRLPEDDTRSYP